MPDHGSVERSGPRTRGSAARQRNAVHPGGMVQNSPESKNPNKNKTMDLTENSPRMGENWSTGGPDLCPRAAVDLAAGPR